MKQIFVISECFLFLKRSNEFLDQNGGRYVILELVAQRDLIVTTSTSASATIICNIILLLAIK